MSQQPEGTYHVNQNIQRTLPLLDKLSSVMLFPFLLLILSKIAFESFLAPRAVDWIRNRSKSGNRLVFAGIFEEQCQSAMTTHTMTADADSARIDLLERSKDGFRQLLCDIAVHIIAFVPRCFGGINVEAST